MAYIKSSGDKLAHAVEDCETVLGDSTAAELSREKALYRRGLARVGLEQWAAAVADLAQVVKKSPTGAVQKELKEARRQLQAQTKREEEAKGRTKKGKSKSVFDNVADELGKADEAIAAKSKAKRSIGAGIQEMTETEDISLAAEQARAEAFQRQAKAKRAAIQKAKAEEQAAAKKEVGAEEKKEGQDNLEASLEEELTKSPPRSAKEFNTAWKLIRKNPIKFLKYFSVRFRLGIRCFVFDAPNCVSQTIDPIKLPAMFKLADSLTDEHLESICLVLGTRTLSFFFVLSALICSRLG